jgi:hypothetical protein
MNGMIALNRNIRPGLAAVSLLMMSGRCAHAGPIGGLVAGPGAMYAIRDGDVLTFDERGAVIARCARFAAPPSRRRAAAIGAPDPAETLRLAGLPDDDSTLEAEELLEDEGPTPRPRAAGAIAPVVPRALAADRDGVWIATSDGLYREGPGGCRRAALAGRDLVAVATDGTAVAAASRDALFRGEADPVGQLAMGPATPLPAAPRALAVDLLGSVLIAGDAGLLHPGSDGTLVRVVEPPAEALAACGQAVLALTRDGVVLWDGQRAVRVGPRPPVKAVACAAGGWVAAGLGVWGSPDGADWAPDPDGLGLDLTAVVSVGGTLWVAGEDGLTPLRPQPLPDGLAGFPADSGGPWKPRLGTPPGWRLPIVTASLLIDRTPLRRAVTGMLLLTFPLGRRPVLTAAGEVAAQALRRDAALAGEEVALWWSASGVEGGEAAARLAAVRDEREAPP